jgi:hypothetical protein
MEEIRTGSGGAVVLLVFGRRITDSATILGPFFVVKFHDFYQHVVLPPIPYSR